MPVYGANNMIGREISRYRILRKLGAGGMGEVYLATDTTLDRHVALKVLPAAFANDAGRTRRLELEAKAASALNHPNVAHIYEIGSVDGTTFIAMEYVEGVSLDKKILDGSLSVAEVFSISMQVLDALELAHSKGVIHRDLKPGNILITPKNQVKIVDFGLAKVTKEENLSSDSLTWTNAGTIQGTLLYMSPEQALGRRVEHRSDIFSFGIVLYEMLTSRRPFAGANPSQALDSLLHHDPAPVSHFRQDTSTALDVIVSRCLERKLESRYGSASEVAGDLKALTLKPDMAVSAPVRALPAVVVRSSSRPAKLVWSILLVILALAASSLYWLAAVVPDTLVDSLAVMPFENASSDPEMEYLSDGVTENLINRLSQLPQLRVLSRGSVFQYKGRPIDPRKVGGELTVGAVLTGKVSQRGDALSIQAELVETKTGAQLWGNKYTNRKASDIFEVQEEIYRQIAESLKLKLTAEEEQRNATRNTDNVEAYNEYLKGLWFLNKRTGSDIVKAIGFFGESAREDPRYALAHAGLAYSYALLGSVEYGALPPEESIEKAKAEAKQALALDEDLADAHVLLAFVNLYYDWNWAEAEREFKRAIELKPSLDTAHHWYAEFLAAMGRPEEAFREIRRAEQTSPLSLIINTADGRVHYLARQWSEAAGHLEKTLEMDPDFVMAQVALGFVYVQQGKHGPAEELFRKANSRTGGAVVTRTALAYGYAMAGKKAESLQIVKALTTPTPGVYVSPAYLAAIYAGLGMNDEAFACLDRAVEERSGSLVFLKVEPVVDKLRSDPRFDRLIRSIGL